MPTPSDFEDVLRAAVADYNGSRAQVIRRMPELYRFYTVLYADDTLPRPARAIVSKVLAYFVVQDDVLPDDQLGPMGFIDDVFVAAHGYRQLVRECSADVLYAAWPGDDDLDDVMSLAHREARAEVSKKLRHILELAGFR
jgi:uncharacterized membrane protein YkvA (DUF1232 family)